MLSFTDWYKISLENYAILGADSHMEANAYKVYKSHILFGMQCICILVLLQAVKLNRVLTSFDLWRGKIS